jgi:hypothetical protein
VQRSSWEVVEGPGQGAFIDGADVGGLYGARRSACGLDDRVPGRVHGCGEAAAVPVGARRECAACTITIRYLEQVPHRGGTDPAAQVA